MWLNLMWKKWRQLRALFIGGAVICLIVIPSYYLLPQGVGISSVMEWLSRAVPVVILLFVLPVFRYRPRSFGDCA